MNKKKKFIPGWVPVYVTGRNGFSEKLNEALLQSGLPYMPGYYFDNNAQTGHTLIWVDKDTPMKTYKRAIGARNLWKYRIRFFTSLSDFSAFACRHESGKEELEPAA
ncbi:MAG: hypothetical protein KatS3mg032_0075 [Cyclobacteriaceae bacterium]|nr:MAG: hypothetical protein KatS3mg032_0075 [Cyclobacteriaceae bacterium]